MKLTFAIMNGPDKFDIVHNVTFDGGSTFSPPRVGDEVTLYDEDGSTIVEEMVVQRVVWTGHFCAEKGRFRQGAVTVYM